jgi:mannose-6-phosphate isomerase-like protein (cupin superfamily)
MLTATQAYVSNYSDTKEFWFADTTARILAERSKTNGAFSLVKLSIPFGSAAPLHIHHTHDEAFFVLFGALKGICGETTWEASSGSFVFLPRGVQHTFLGVSEIPTEALVFSVPGGFDEFVSDAGYPISEHTDTTAFTADPQALAEISLQHDIEIVGPPVDFLG